LSEAEAKAEPVTTREAEMKKVRKRMLDFGEYIIVAIVVVIVVVRLVRASSCCSWRKT